MLVLTRKIGEEIVITTPHGEARIALIEVRGDRAKIGITAPREWPVFRAELVEPRTDDAA